MSRPHAREGSGGRDVTRWVLSTAAVLILVMGLSSIANAATGWSSHDYDMSGDGTLTYPNEGWVQIETHSTKHGIFDELYYTHSTGFTIYISGHASMIVNMHACTSTDPWKHLNRFSWFDGAWHYSSPNNFNITNSYSGALEGTASPSAGSTYVNFESRSCVGYYGDGEYMDSYMTIYVSPNIIHTYNISGSMACIDNVSLYVKINNSYVYATMNDSAYYAFEIIDNTDYMLVFSDGAYYDFTCSGSDIVFDYDACTWVYGYTCGVDTVKLYDNNSQLIDTASQSSGYDIYEMQIADGMEYTISFYDLGIVLCYNQTFTCTGDHVHIDYDRCEWVYPPYPPAPPIPIYVWAGYDYNIVVFRDDHGNFIENSHLAIYDKTDNKYLQRWTDATDGYTLLGARFDTDHDIKLSLRTFDGIFILDTTYPANGSALVGEEDITTTNWTIPIKYNLNVLPVDQYGVPLFDVFCGLSEYTPLNPGAFWGMDLSDRGYVPVANCSGFAMCDIIAEKDGYVDYRVEALNWTSKSALVKDYRHNIVMEEE